MSVVLCLTTGGNVSVVVPDLHSNVTMLLRQLKYFRYFLYGSGDVRTAGCLWARLKTLTNLKVNEETAALQKRLPSEITSPPPGYVHISDEDFWQEAKEAWNHCLRNHQRDEQNRAFTPCHCLVKACAASATARGARAVRSERALDTTPVPDPRVLEMEAVAPLGCIGAARLRIHVDRRAGNRL